MMNAAPRRLESNTLYVNRWAAASHTDPNKEYVVSQKSDGNWACACPAWKFKKAPRPDCKHILGIKYAEPVDMTKTSKKAAEQFVAAVAKVKAGAKSVVMVEVIGEPVFLLQTQRKIIVRD